ncbi:MAG TPA: hypothetical protein VF638_14515 [Sphingomonas sp.]
MKHALTFAIFVLGVSTSSSNFAQSVGTDMMKKPGNWRGTLIEGTDAIVATNKYGEPLFVETGETVAQIFTPAPMDGDRLANEFKKLCIDTDFDQDRLASAIPSSSLALRVRRLTIPPQKQGGAYEAVTWHSPEARAQIWGGDVTGLKNRQTLSRWRNGATSSPFDPGRMFASACNVTVMARAFNGPEPFVAAMSRILGVQPQKSVIKSSWADGFWQIPAVNGELRKVFFSMVDLDRSEQLLHVAIAAMPPKQVR